MLALAVAFFDQLTKQYVRTRLANGESLFGFGPFGFTRFDNSAGPFSLPLPMQIMVGLHILVLALLFHAYAKYPKHRTGLIWILCGGISNLVDRLIFNYTTDYLALPFGGYWNLADVSVLVGIAILAFSKPVSPQLKA